MHGSSKAWEQEHTQLWLTQLERRDSHPKETGRGAGLRAKAGELSFGQVESEMLVTYSGGDIKRKEVKGRCVWRGEKCERADTIRGGISTEMVQKLELIH